MMFCTRAFAVLIVMSWKSESDAIDVDTNPCLQEDWVKCGINLGKALFTLYSWSDEVAYQVQKQFNLFQ